MSELQSLSSHISQWRSQQLNLISKQIQQNLRSIQSPHKEKCEKMKKFIATHPMRGSGDKWNCLWYVFFMAIGQKLW